MTNERMVWWAIGAFAFAAGTLPAQVPPDIATKLIAIGRGVCVPETAELYAPLQPKPPYAGVKFTRDVSFGPDAKNVLDVAEPEKGGGSRPVLDLSFGRGRQQATGWSERRGFLRQHHGLGGEERHGRSEHAAPWRRGVGRSGERCELGGAVGEQKHRTAQRESKSGFCLVAVRREDLQHLMSPTPSFGEPRALVSKA